MERFGTKSLTENYITPGQEPASIINYTRIGSSGPPRIKKLHKGVNRVVVY